MSADDSTEAQVEALADAGDLGSPSAPARRGERVMAAVRWCLLAMVTALAGYTVWTYWGPGASAEPNAVDRYYCPMHPQIRSPEPGECPICNMFLEPIPSERSGGEGGEARSDADSAAGSEAAGRRAPHPGEVVSVTLSGEKQRLVGIATSPVERASPGGRVRVPGIVSAPESGISQVRVRAAGFVERVLVRQTGVEVERGQVLAYVFSPEVYRAQEEFLAAARWGAESAADASAGAGTEELVAAARRGLELLGMSAADIDGLARRGAPQRALPLRAGAAGFVTRFDAVPGSRADPEMVLYEIADLSQVWVTASVHEHDLDALKVGAAARFLPGDGRDPPIEGRIELIEPAIAAATQTTRVRVVVANREGALRPGQFGDVELDLPIAEGLFVPSEAVIRAGKHDYVYVGIGEERFEPRTIRTGAVRDNRVEVVEGLVEGERVVVRGSFMLDSESRLQASLAATPGAAAGAEPDEGDATTAGDVCDSAIDRAKFPDEHARCLACAQRHPGMAAEIEACRRQIPGRWR